ncbi:MAG TPA: (d)CMP kinase [Acidimicrobiales bacterium]|nr:(d)CMP kinase [Acidimicrobiales bacterium]
MPAGLRIIAIDGPAGSGKSTVARRVASRLGLDYLDTGAMYRSVAFEAMRRGIDPDDAATVAELARQIELTVDEKVTVNGADATVEIRSPEVTRAVSVVAANPEVRREMVMRQREWAEGRGGGVVEGRDIGTVVFPDSPVKVYLTANEEERASRRSREMLDRDFGPAAAEVAHVAHELARRDRVDSTRAASPLAVAEDAVQIDTTGIDADEVVERVMALVAQRIGES